MQASLSKRIFSAAVRLSEDPWQVMQLSIRCSALCILLSLLLSREIWFQENRLLLPSPLFPWAGDIPNGVNELLYAILFLGSALLFALPEKRRAGFLLVPVYALLVMQDQVRWQFYLYMTFFNLLVAAVAPEKVKDVHLDALRYMVIGVYLWAGIYKMNPYFMSHIFPWFISAWFPYTGIAQIIGIVVPFLEAAIGVFLFIPKTRWIGQWMAAAMLAVAFLSIGPYGLPGWKYVWPINVYLDCFAVLLFMDRKRSLWNKEIFKNAMTALSIALFVGLPGLGAGNYLGHHQSFKLFCCTYYAVVVDKKGDAVTKASFRKLPPGMHEKLYISSYPVVQTEYLPAPKGMCPYLKNPEAVRLKVVEDAAPFWSGDAEESLYDICSEKPKLISRKRLEH